MAVDCGIKHNIIRLLVKVRKVAQEVAVECEKKATSCFLVFFFFLFKTQQYCVNDKVRFSLLMLQLMISYL